VLWAFLFAPSIGIVTYVIRKAGYNWDWVLQGDQAMLLVVMAATWKQISYNFLFFLAGLQSIPALAHRGRGHRRRRPRAPFLDDRLPAAVADHFLSARRQHRVCVLRHLRVIDSTTQGGPAGATQILVYKVYYDGVKAGDLGGSSAQSVILMLIVIALTVVQFSSSRERCSTEWPTHGREPALADGFVARRADRGNRGHRLPLYVTFVASTLTLDQILQVPMPLVPGDRLWENYSRALAAGASGAAAAPVGRMMLNSLVMAAAIALGKIAISLIASFAIVYFRFPLRNFFFWMIFVTLMLPVEVRIIPTYKVVSDLGILNSYVGLTLPLIASATATFLFRQFFLTIPEELAEASRIDGAGRCASFSTWCCRFRRPALRRCS